MSFFELSAIYISFLTVVLVIGFIKFDKKIKKKIMLVLSTIYNIAMGYVDTVFLLVTYAFYLQMASHHLKYSVLSVN